MLTEETQCIKTPQKCIWVAHSGTEYIDMESYLVLRPVRESELLLDVRGCVSVLASAEDE